MWIIKHKGRKQKIIRINKGARTDVERKIRPWRTYNEEKSILYGWITRKWRLKLKRKWNLTTQIEFLNNAEAKTLNILS